MVADSRTTADIRPRRVNYLQSRQIIQTHTCFRPRHAAALAGHVGATSDANYAPQAATRADSPPGSDTGRTPARVVRLSEAIGRDTGGQGPPGGDIAKRAPASGGGRARTFRPRRPPLPRPGRD